jgi:hypothetical protein
MMQMWQKAMTPGEWHAALEPMVGSFHARTTFVRAKGDPPSVSDGTSENRLVLGGRYLEQVYRGTSMGMPFEGIGYTGYENVRKRYIGVWMDTFGTSLMYSVGIGKPTQRAIELGAMAQNPSGKADASLQDHDPGPRPPYLRDVDQGPPTLPLHAGRVHPQVAAPPVARPDPSGRGRVSDERWLSQGIALAFAWNAEV